MSVLKVVKEEATIVFITKKSLKNIGDGQTYYQCNTPNNIPLTLMGFIHKNYKTIQNGSLNFNTLFQRNFYTKQHGLTLSNTL
jgi:lysozyme family protein